MAPTLLQIAESVQRQKASKWVWDVHHFAAKLGISVEQASCFLKCIEKGGKGVKKDGTWTANPAPFNKKIDLSSDADNILDLHLRSEGRKVGSPPDFGDPTPAIVNQSGQYVRLGKVRSFKQEITVTLQKDIAKYVMGTHRELVKHWPKVAEKRKEIWRSWIDGGSNSELFQKTHFPWIVAKFGFVWDTPVAKDVNPLAISPTILDHAKVEVVEMLVRMYIIPPSNLDLIMVRRSRRSVIGNNDVTIEPIEKRARLTPSVSSPDTDTDTDVEDDSTTLHRFNLRELKELWKSGEQKEVGRREIALIAAHAGRSRFAVNTEISDLGGFPLSVEEYDDIRSVSKSDMGKKMGNFDKLRTWINSSLPFEHMRIREGQHLLEFARAIERFNSGENLPSEMMRHGQLTSEAAAVIRHILYSHPKIGWVSFVLLLSEFFVLLNGRKAREDELPSIATIRNHIAQLDGYCQHDARESIREFTEKLSPKGNRVFFGGGGDGTCHGKADTREVCMIVTNNNDYHDPNNPWKIDPSFHVTSAASPAGSDSKANSEYYLDSIEEFVPPESIASLLVFGIDNCNTAKKDGRLTTEGAQARAIHHGHEDKTMAHGVKIRGFNIGDAFHRHQLSVKWFSETACGKTEKGCHEQIHHRQVSTNKMKTCALTQCPNPIDCCVFFSDHSSQLGHVHSQTACVHAKGEGDSWRPFTNLDAKTDAGDRHEMGIEWQGM